MALQLLLMKAWEWGVQSLQIFGDSKIILEWAKGNQRCNILRLRPLLEQVIQLKSLFDLISFTHVYKERNSSANRLSKEGAQLQAGEDKTKCFLRDPGGYYHRPFREYNNGIIVIPSYFVMVFLLSNLLVLYFQYFQYSSSDADLINHVDIMYFIWC